MVIPLILLIVLVGLAVFFYRIISLGKITAMSRLVKKRQTMEAKFDYLVRRRLELKSEITRKEQKLETLRNNQQGMKIKTADEMNIEEESDDERISNLLLTMGKITMEQNEKVLQKKEVLKMDYLSTCLTLGFIDAETGKKIFKGTTGR